LTVWPQCPFANPNEHQNPTGLRLHASFGRYDFRRAQRHRAEQTLHDLSAKEMLPLVLQKKLNIALTLLPHKLPRELNLKLLERYEPSVVVGITHPMAKSKLISLNQMASEPVAALARKDYPY
jgi:hypothetical protein